MKKLAAIMVSFFVTAGCAHVTGKDCAKLVLQVGVGAAVFAATGVDIMDYDPWSTNAILADVAVESSMAATGYVLDEMTESDYFADQALGANEDIALPEDRFTYIEYPPQLGCQRRVHAIRLMGVHPYLHIDDVARQFSTPPGLTSGYHCTHHPRHKKKAEPH